MKFSDIIVKDTDIKKVWHVSETEIKILKNQRMWFDIEKKNAEFYFNDLLKRKNSAFLYEFTLNNNLKILSYSKIKEYSTDLNADLMSMLFSKETEKTLKDIKSDGYEGLIQKDYDPSNYQKTIFTLFVFNSKQTVNNFKLLK